MGDTIVLPDKSNSLPGFKPIKPQVFAALYPLDSGEFESFRESLEKLALNDAALQFEPEQSQALGSGFRCGFWELCIWKLLLKDFKESME